MSSLAISNASPFATALPAPHVFMAVDADGDAIMTDAVTGLPITYGAPAPASGKRERSASLDSDGADSRPSKRSRSSSDETDYADMPPLIPASALAPPPAPQKAPRPPVASSDDQDGDGAESAMRNLAEQMAEAVLQGEPRDAPAEPAPAPMPPAGDGPVDAEPEEWCMSVTVSDLALRLDMRHPRVVLNLLRFVETYNELAPPGEEIHFPLMPEFAVENLFSHESIVNPAPEFASEVAELRALVERYSAPPPPEDYEDDGYSTESSHRSWGRRDRY